MAKDKALEGRDLCSIPGPDIFIFFEFLVSDPAHLTTRHPSCASRSSHWIFFQSRSNVQQAKNSVNPQMRAQLDHAQAIGPSHLGLGNFNQHPQLKLIQAHFLFLLFFYFILFILFFLFLKIIFLIKTKKSIKTQKR